ncbi:MAG: lysophospholipid acyltransferase family protein, partial [Candidatus Limnocylindria bacterium]
LLWATKRRIAKHNFSVVLGRPPTDPEVARVARRSFRNFAKYLVEIMRFPLLGVADFERLVTIEGWEHLRGALAHGKGVIFVSIHFGKVLRALRRNEMVGLMMDLGPRAQAFDNVEAVFFGTSTSFPSVAASLARVSGAPIVVSACVRHADNTFTGIAMPPIFVERTKQAAEDVQ